MQTIFDTDMYLEYQTASSWLDGDNWDWRAAWLSSCRQLWSKTSRFLPSAAHSEITLLHFLFYRQKMVNEVNIYLRYTICAFHNLFYQFPTQHSASLEGVRRDTPQHLLALYSQTQRSEVLLLLHFYSLTGNYIEKKHAGSFQFHGPMLRYWKWVIGVRRKEGNDAMSCNTHKSTRAKRFPILI